MYLKSKTKSHLDDEAWMRRHVLLKFRQIEYILTSCTVNTYFWKWKQKSKDSEKDRNSQTIMSDHKQKALQILWTLNSTQPV